MNRLTLSRYSNKDLKFLSAPGCRMHIVAGPTHHEGVRMHDGMLSHCVRFFAI